MEIPREIITPLIITNVFSVLLVLVCLYSARAGQSIWAVIFLSAAATNAYIAIANPGTYVSGFGPVAVLDIYRNFIYGAFAENVTYYVLAIAAFQFILGVLIFCEKFRFKLGIIGGIIFLAFITPLGFGSAFPATLFMIGSLSVLYFKYPF